MNGLNLEVFVSWEVWGDRVGKMKVGVTSNLVDL
jgi:hypothetical protein